MSERLTIRGGPRRTSHLTQLETHKLWNCVEGMKETIGKNRMSAKQVADEASESLGFTVSPSSVKKAAKGLGIALYRRPTRRAERPVQKGRLTIRIEELTVRVAVAESVLGKAVARIDDLETQLGIKKS